MTVGIRTRKNAGHRPAPAMFLPSPTIIPVTQPVHTALAHDAGVELLACHERVVARLFRPGGVTHEGTLRTESIMNRVLAIPADTIPAHAKTIVDDFGDRHARLIETLVGRAATLRGPDAAPISQDLAIVIGASFTAEYAVECAALCNPSAVRHPNQDGLEPGELRVLVSMRSIGEGHVSSIQFCEAIIGADQTWRFLPRATPLHQPAISPGIWIKDRFLDLLERHGVPTGLVLTVGQPLPDTFDATTVEDTLQGLTTRPLPGQSQTQVDQIRATAASIYQATFPDDSDVTARVLLPVADSERMGIEDARFVEFRDGDTREYRGTYTAYDGHSATSRLVTTPDFRTFDVHRVSGGPTLAKGMALFPRPVGGELLALGRGDNESMSISRSVDGLDWSPEEWVYVPEALWEVVQSGNCGPPIETSEGWLVLTHGVGPMRVYSIGAMLLDLNDPTVVLAVLPVPLLSPEGADRTGYVPNVFYSCGAIVHDGTLWIPHGVGDDRIRVASVPLHELFAAMTWLDASGAGESAA